MVQRARDLVQSPWGYFNPPNCSLAIEQEGKFPAAGSTESLATERQSTRQTSSRATRSIEYISMREWQPTLISKEINFVKTTTAEETTGYQTVA